MNQYREKIERDIEIPDHVKAKMKELGITSLPKIKKLATDYIIESGELKVDWWYFNNWVAMGYSDH